MEQKLDLIIQMIKDQGKQINGAEESLNTKIDRIEESLNTKIDSVREELLANDRRIEQKLDNLSNQVTVLEAYAHEKCEAALDGWASHLEKQEKLGSNVTILNSKAENHEIRITVLEDILEA